MLEFHAHRVNSLCLGGTTKMTSRNKSVVVELRTLVAQINEVRLRIDSLDKKINVVNAEIVLAEATCKSYSQALVELYGMLANREPMDIETAAFLRKCLDDARGELDVLREARDAYAHAWLQADTEESELLARAKCIMLS